MRVLIADDEPFARAKLKKHLEEAGCAIVSEHGDGESVLEWLAVNPKKADALFLDIRMPRASGLDVAAYLKEEVPIVFITGHREYALPAWEFAAVDYIEKPVSAEKINRVVERLRARVIYTRYQGRVPTIIIRNTRSLQEVVPILLVESFSVSDRLVTARIEGDEADHEVVGPRTLREIEEAYPLETWRLEGDPSFVGFVETRSLTFSGANLPVR